MDETPENQRALENSVDSSWVRLGTHQYFAKEHLRAAQFMAESCQRREQQCAEDGITGLDGQIRYYALAAIVESASFLEAVVNELRHDASSPFLAEKNPYLEGLDQRAVGTLRELATKSRVERSLGLLEKYDLTLLCAGKAPIDRGRSPAQDVVALIRARNALVHFKPEIQWD